MGEAIGDVLPLAIGVALSPIPIIAVVLMLATPSGKTNGIAYALGWVTGLAVVSAIVLAVGGSESDEPADWVGWTKLAIGALFLLLAAAQWRKRPKAGEEAELPKWMQAIDQFNPGKSFGLGVVLSALNPKNLGLTLAAALSVAQLGLSTSQEVVAMAVFVVIASVTIAGPVLIYLVMGERARSLLDGLRAWMGAHNAAIMTVLFLVIGAKLLGDGIAQVF